ncbi:unnamed protein product [Prunus brigantina]
MGTIVRRARKHSVPLEIGCMINLYASVANIDVQHFQAEAFSSSAEQGGGIFVKESARFIITDDLHVMSPFSVASNPEFTKLGAMNENITTEQQTWNIGVHVVLNLCLRSLVSKKPLSETFLKHNPVPNPNLSNLNLDQLILTCIESLMLEDTMNEEEEEKIVVKLTVSHMRDASFKGALISCTNVSNILTSST